MARWWWPWFHQHEWEPRAVTHWYKPHVVDSIQYTTLLEVCRCGERRQSQWDGKLELSHFMVSPGKAVEDLLNSTK